MSDAPAQLAPDVSAMVAFVRALPELPRLTATAFVPDRVRETLFSLTFTPNEVESVAERFAKANREGYNVYLHVNVMREEMSGVGVKPRKVHVRLVYAIHGDVDPRDGEPVTAESDRLIAEFTNPDTMKARGLPPPSLVVMSGSGVQAYWFLRDAFPLAPDDADDAAKERTAEEFERYTRGVEAALGDADNTHDVSRMFRWAGTVNHPDEKKRAKGRVPALSFVVAHNPERRYTPAEFPIAPPKGAPKAVASVSIDAAKVKPIGHVDELGSAVSDSVKVYIVNGEDPNSPGHFTSRSEMLLWVVCELKRAGVADETIYSVITNPRFKVSESVLEKGRGADRYARRQIERASDFVGDDIVSAINRDYFAAIEGSRNTFYREEKDGPATPMNAEAFRFELAIHKVEFTDSKGSTKSVPALDIWKESPRRRFYPRGFVLDPTFTADEGRYNLWRSFGVAEAPGDWSLIRKHIESVLADGHPEHADYIIRWIAWKVQNPAGIPRVALLFRGEEGIGKGFLCNGLVTMFGSHGLRVHSMMQVAGRFNAHMRHLCILFADEATVVDEEQEGALKGIITEPTLPIEGKGKDIIHADNHLAVVMASNKQWMVPAGIGARRFAVFNVSAKHKGNADYFSALFNQAMNGGWAAMLHDLRRMDLGKWHPEAHRPNTDALTDQQIQSLKGLERIVADCLITGEIPCGTLRGEHIFIPTGTFCEYVASRTRAAEPSANEVQRLLGRVLGFQKADKERPRGWVLPPLAEARAAWNRALFIVAWPEESGWSMGIPDYRGNGEVSNAF